MEILIICLVASEQIFIQDEHIHSGIIMKEKKSVRFGGMNSMDSIQ